MDNSEAMKTKMKVSAESDFARALFVACRWLTSCVFTWQREEFLQPHPLFITSLCPHFHISSQWRLGFQHMNF